VGVGVGVGCVGGRGGEPALERDRRSLRLVASGRRLVAGGR
jgi:hypothetical protein